METITKKYNDFNFKSFIEKVIFVYSGKIAVSFYVTILLGLVIYAFFNLKEFFSYILEIHTLDSKTAMLYFIELIDMSMVAHLGIMVVKGSYNSFVSKDHAYAHEKIGSGLLKVKMKTSLINIVAVSLLQRAIMVDATGWSELLKIGFIYALFLIGALVLEHVDYSHLKSELLYEHPLSKIEEEEKKHNENTEKH